MNWYFGEYWLGVQLITAKWCKNIIFTRDRIKYWLINKQSNILSDREKRSGVIWSIGSVHDEFRGYFTTVFLEWFKFKLNLTYTEKLKRTSGIFWIKELSLCQKLKYLNPYIIRTRLCKPLILIQTQIIWSNRECLWSHENLSFTIVNQHLELKLLIKSIKNIGNQGERRKFRDKKYI